MSKSRQRILLIPDEINGINSGGQSVRATLKYLIELGYSVAVYSKDATTNVHPDVRSAAALYVIPTKLRWYEHFYAPVLVPHFVNILNSFKPAYIFFCGSIQKPAVLSSVARGRGIKTVFLFYINDYYCHRVYAGLASGPCFKCLGSNSLPALRNDCVKRKDFHKFITRWLVKFRLGIEIRKAHKVLCYGNDQVNLYQNFGVPTDRIAVVGFQFDPSDLQDIPINDEGYFAITGQPIMQKGWHLLVEILQNLKTGIKLKVSMKDEDTARHIISLYGLSCFVEAGVIEIITGLSDRSDYLKFIASARGILLPTYYPTTGEFVLQEAMFLGKPIHVFDVGVHRDVLTDRKNAMVSPVGDISDYSKKIDEINCSEELRNRICVGAKRSAKAFYSLERRKLLNHVFAS